MRINPEAMRTLQAVSEVIPGNIYPAKGGKKPGTDYWLVVAVSESSAHLIGLNANGDPVSTASYYKRAMRERPVIGRVELPTLEMKL